MTTLFYIFAFLFGAAVGSFLNVCIARIPQKESIVTGPSHCESCGRRLAWYEMVPIVSWLVLGGKCRTCKAKLSSQYPLIEAGNGLLWVLITLVLGLSWDSLFCCLASSALLVAAFVDGRTGEIPPGVDWFILALGVLHLALHLSDWPKYVIGFLAVSLPLYLLLLATGGRGIGGGDIKLMAACGLLVGWKLILLAFAAACILGSVIHLLRMRLKGAGRTLALGPYLAAGTVLSMLWGESLIAWYTGFLH